jgi:hypothetical protein
MTPLSRNVVVAIGALFPAAVTVLCLSIFRQHRLSGRELPNRLVLQRPLLIVVLAVVAIELQLSMLLGHSARWYTLGIGMACNALILLIVLPQLLAPPTQP